jgi:hypothetical protein
LQHEFRAQLEPKSREDLLEMLGNSENWFTYKILPISPEKLRYPNAYMGDAICLWLVHELKGTVDAGYRSDFKKILAYYRDKNWNWGEHLSDMYCKICQNKLCALLLWASNWMMKLAPWPMN